MVFGFGLHRRPSNSGLGKHHHHQDHQQQQQQQQQRQQQHLSSTLSLDDQSQTPSNAASSNQPMQSIASASGTGNVDENPLNLRVYVKRVSFLLFFLSTKILAVETCFVSYRETF